MQYSSGPTSLRRLILQIESFGHVDVTERVYGVLTGICCVLSTIIFLFCAIWATITFRMPKKISTEMNVQLTQCEITMEIFHTNYSLLIQEIYYERDEGTRKRMVRRLLNELDDNLSELNPFCCVPGPTGRNGPNGGRNGSPGIQGAPGKAGKLKTIGCGGQFEEDTPCSECQPSLRGQKGLSGQKGTQGASGLLGPNGTPGSSGACGEKGASGGPGFIGRKGAKGDPGISQSLSGERGAVGPHGLRGLSGASGLSGQTRPGSKGMAGRTGRLGLSGTSGQIGPMGDMGPAGAAGFCPSECDLEEAAEAVAEHIDEERAD